MILRLWIESIESPYCGRIRADLSGVHLVTFADKSMLAH